MKFHIKNTYKLTIVKILKLAKYFLFNNIKYKNYLRNSLIVKIIIKNLI